MLLGTFKSQMNTNVIKGIFGILFHSIRVNLIYGAHEVICTYYSCCILYMKSASAIHECFARVTIYSFTFNVFKTCRNFRLLKIFFMFNFTFRQIDHLVPAM